MTKERGNNTKYSYEQVKNIFSEQNCELLSSEYKNAKEKLDYRCSCGKVSTARLTHFLKGHRCRSCGSRKTTDFNKLSHDDVKKMFEDNGCTLISKKYKNNHTLMDYKCDCGSVSKITLSHLREGRRCKKCGLAKMSGPNNPNYNPNLTDEDRINRRKVAENDIWRNKIYDRDDYTCQRCFQRGGKLNAHHIFNYCSHKDLRFEEGNGVTFCGTCHRGFHKKYGITGNNQNQLDEFLRISVSA